MRRRYVNYNLENGFIDNWLVAGPQEIPVELDQLQGENFKSKLVQEYYQSESGITKTPVERGPLTKGLFGWVITKAPGIISPVKKIIRLVFRALFKNLSTYVPGHMHSFPVNLPRKWSWFSLPTAQPISG